MDCFVEFVNDFVEFLPDQLGPEAVGITLRLIMLLKPLCTFSSLNSWIATLLDLCNIPLPASSKLDQLWMIADLILLRMVQVVWGPAVAFEARDHRAVSYQDGQGSHCQRNSACSIARRIKYKSQLHIPCFQIDRKVI